MCELINKDILVQRYSENVDSIMEMSEVINEMTEKDSTFANSLLDQFLLNENLSVKQWKWVRSLTSRIKGIKPIYGNFAAVYTMFLISGEKLKFPKIRLVTNDGKFLLISFNREKPSSPIEIATGGYANHGKRVFRGWIHKDRIIPYMEDSIDNDIEMTLQEFSLDPIQAAKAHAAKLGVCIFCHKPLTDATSKHHGYGKTCAGNWKLPYGNIKVAK